MPLSGKSPTVLVAVINTTMKDPAEAGPLIERRYTMTHHDKRQQTQQRTYRDGYIITPLNYA